jgi:hypothetical protein
MTRFGVIAAIYIQDLTLLINNTAISYPHAKQRYPQQPAAKAWDMVQIRGLKTPLQLRRNEYEVPLPRTGTLLSS